MPKVVHKYEVIEIPLTELFILKCPDHGIIEVFALYKMAVHTALKIDIDEVSYYLCCRYDYNFLATLN